jgi:hypothetical protein
MVRWWGYIDCPDEDAFIVFMSETDEFLAAGIDERGEEHVECFNLWPGKEVIDRIRQREANVL